MASFNFTFSEYEAIFRVVWYFQTLFMYLLVAVICIVLLSV